MKVGYFNLHDKVYYKVKAYNTLNHDYIHALISTDSHAIHLVIVGKLIVLIYTCSIAISGFQD